MPENKVRKYFQLIEAWAWCDICGDMVALKLDKKEIINGLQTGIYTKEYKHFNKHMDTDDPDDRSGEEHSIYIYINDNYDITGVKSFFGDSLSTSELDAAAAKKGTEVRIPVVVKDIPELNIHLGMLTQEEYVVLKVCDGMNTIEDVAQIAQKTVEEIEGMMKKLRGKGLVKVIRRG